jgi:hypothetical protein
MFGLKKFFSAKEQRNIEHDHKVQVRSGSQNEKFPIGYDEHLIGRLKDDHGDLVRLFTSVIRHAENKRFTKAITELSSFRTLLTSHLITENTKLYIYLNYAYKQDSATSEMVSHFRKEMSQIGKAVMSFIQEYDRSGITVSNQQAFLRQAREIATILVNRIETEEQRLYEIYEFSLAMDTHA